MNKRITLEIESNGNVVDTKGYLVGNVSCIELSGFDSEKDISSDRTVELVKLGVSVDEIIKLKNMDLI